MSAEVPQQYVTEDNVYHIPLSDMVRPIPPVLDEEKVCYLMKSISEEGQQVPIDVLKAPNGKLYGFGGCHRTAVCSLCFIY
jgi:uncharacterized ParB-like nuclease family protein